MPDKFIPSRDEDTERKKLSGLAKELGWTFHKDASKDDSISGEWEAKKTTIKVDSRFLFHDVLEYALQDPSRLTAVICRETFFTKGAQALANFMKQLGLDTKCDLKTGEPFIDQNFFFEVRFENRDKFEALLSHKETVPLLKQILSTFDQIAFEPKGITFYKFIEKGDLEITTVKAALQNLRQLDRLDHIYF